MRVRHLILDRDGVLNREAPDGSYVLRPNEFDWLPGALEALERLHRAGIRLTVATNQSAVGRGLMCLPQLEIIHARMQAEARAYQAPLDAVLVCPHAPDAGCPCRKPAPGLILEAIRRAAPIGAEETLVVGDDLRDLEAAQRAGVRAVLVRTGKGRALAERLAGGPFADVPVFEDLSELAERLANAEERLELPVGAVDEH